MILLSAYAQERLPCLPAGGQAVGFMNSIARFLQKKMKGRLILPGRSSLPAFRPDVPEGPNAARDRTALHLQQLDPLPGGVERRVQRAGKAVVEELEAAP